MVIKAISGSSAWQFDPADRLRTLAATATKPTTPTTPCKTRLRPEVVVFDTFGFKNTDVNHDGIGDVDHGDITAAIIRGRTGAKMTLVSLHDDDGGLKALDELLTRKNVSNLYLNFSVELGPKTLARICRLAERGAQVYIAAGNDTINPLSTGQRHPNIHVVGASGGIVGASTRSGTLQTIRSPSITDVANGRLRFSNVRGGVDFTSDGNADIVPRAIWNNAANQRLSTVDMTAAVIKRGTLTRNDGASQGNGVVSIREMRRNGLVSESAIRFMATNTGLSISRLETMYLHIGAPVARYGDPGTLGNTVLYEVDKSTGRLRTVTQNPPGGAFTSWATPEQLSNDLNRASRCK